MIVTTLLAAPVMGAQPTATHPPAWIRADKAMFSGELAADNGADKGLPDNFFDELEPAVEMKFGAVHIGPNTTTVFQTQRNISRSFDFPGDEIVRMLSGTITLIDEPSGRTQTFYSGDYFIVPRHWRGLWIFHNLGPAPSREFVTISGAEWGPDRSALNRATLSATANVPGVMAVDLHHAQSQLAPMSFLTPAAAAATLPDSVSQLGYTIFAGEPSLLVLKSIKGTIYDRPPTRCESTIRVMNGSLTLEASRGKAETFQPEDVVVITRQFRGKIHVSSGFTALSAVAAGRDNLDSPNVPPAVNFCPAM